MSAAKVDPGLRAILGAIVVTTLIAFIFLLANGYVFVGVCVAVATALLVGFLAVLRRRLMPDRGGEPEEGRPEASEWQRRLALIRLLGRAQAIAGIVLTIIGAVLWITDTGSSALRLALVPWAGPCLIFGALGSYTGLKMATKSSEGTDTIG